MPFGQRALEAGGIFAEGDKSFFQAVYNDVSGSLTAGMPIFLDIRDAAEFNALGTTKLSPAVNATGGRVVLGTTAAGTGANLPCVGVYQPSNPNDKPNNGDAIRILNFGRGVVSAEAYNAGTAVLVGDYLIVDTTPGTSAVSGHNTAVLGQTIGIALATTTHLASGNSLIAIGGGNVVALINAFVKLL